MAEPRAMSSDAKDLKSAGPESYRAATGGKYPLTGSRIGEFVDAIADHLKLLLLGPIIAALVVLGIVSMLPKSYTSVAYLALDETGARVADARMRSAPVLDKVLSDFRAPRDTLEARRRFVAGNLRIVVAEGETQRTSGLFRMEYSDRNPLVAQKVNSLFIEAWLDFDQAAAGQACGDRSRDRAHGDADQSDFAVDRSAAKGRAIPGRAEPARGTRDAYFGPHLKARSEFGHAHHLEKFAEWHLSRHTFRHARFAGGAKLAEARNYHDCNGIRQRSDFADIRDFAAPVDRQLFRIDIHFQVAFPSVPAPANLMTACYCVDMTGDLSPWAEQGQSIKTMVLRPLRITRSSR